MRKRGCSLTDCKGRRKMTGSARLGSLVDKGLIEGTLEMCRDDRLIELDQGEVSKKVI